MNPAAWKSFDRMLNRMERQSRRPRRRIPTSPFVLAVGLTLGHLLLTRLVPTIWATLLPGGLDQASALRGWPALVWRSAVYGHRHPTAVWSAIAVVSVTSLLVSSWIGPVRPLVWLAAVGVIALDAAILVVTIHTALVMTAADAGLGLG